MQVFPAIDLLGGDAVRLEQGRRESAKIYRTRPWEIARAVRGRRRHRACTSSISTPRSTRGDRRATTTTTRRIEEDRRGDRRGRSRSAAACARSTTARACSTLGVSYVVLGTAAVKNPAMVEAACRRWPQRIVVAVDARDGKVAVEGWTEDTTSDASEIGERVAARRRAAPCSTPTSGATACARGRTSRRRRGWRARWRPAR